MGQFALSWCGSQTVGGAPDESHFTTLRTGGMGVQSVPFLKSKRNPGLDVSPGVRTRALLFPKPIGHTFFWLDDRYYYGKGDTTMHGHKYAGLAAALFAVMTLGSVWSGPQGQLFAATLCVNPGGTGGCFAKIGDAVAAAAKNDTIQVAAGVYAEDVVIGK